MISLSILKRVSSSIFRWTFWESFVSVIITFLLAWWLVVKQSCSYFTLISSYRDLSDKLEDTSPFVLLTYQLYMWLFEVVDLSDWEGHSQTPAGLAEEEHELIWLSIQCKCVRESIRIFCGSTGCRKTGWITCWIFLVLDPLVFIIMIFWKKLSAFKQEEILIEHRQEILSNAFYIRV